MKEKTRFDEGLCPAYHRAIELVGARWTGAVLFALLSGAQRFGEIRDLVRLSDKMLSARLKELEAEGIVARIVLPETPVRIEYHLTDKGRDLEQVVATVGEWAERWIADDRPPSTPPAAARTSTSRRR